MGCSTSGHLKYEVLDDPVGTSLSSTPCPPHVQTWAVPEISSLRALRMPPFEQNPRGLAEIDRHLRHAASGGVANDERFLVLGLPPNLTFARRWKTHFWAASGAQSEMILETKLASQECQVVRKYRRLMRLYIFHVSLLSSVSEGGLNQPGVRAILERGQKSIRHTLA